VQFIAAQKAKRLPVAPFMMPPPIGEMVIASDRLEKLAGESAVAIITLGRNTGEFVDRQVENDFTLTAIERSLIEGVSERFHAKGKKVLVVLNVGGPMEVASWRDKVDAVLLAWLPGQEGGHAIVDVLTGKVNPSGKLATTFPVSYSDVPSAKTFPGKELPGAKPMIVNLFAGKPAEALYDEGIYVVYRYYNTFGVKPAYDFGYGMSYTNFSFGPVKLSTNKFEDKVTASVTVTNTGKVAGKEVVQLYVHAPKQKLKKPESELRAFAKTKLLQPGESQVVSFTLVAKDLASFDPASSSWLAESGSYVIRIGGSTAKMDLQQDVVVEKSRRLLAPRLEIKELEPK
jgi:beta-glucosidase